jgi:outer membrane protein OmpA-like peptidoglycan-associated protein
MRDEWIQGRFTGVYSGDRSPRDSGDPEGSRRFAFEIESGSVSDFELVPEPLETDAPGEPKEIRQARVKRVVVPLIEGEAPTERPLFDVRIRDWKLMHPAESRGRAYGTIVGIVQARLTPPPAPGDGFVAVPRQTVAEDATAPEPDAAESRHDERSHLFEAPGTGVLSASEVHGTDSDVVYARLRWGLAVLLLCTGALAFGLGCGAKAAVVWSAPIVLGLLLRLATRSVPAGSPELHAWLGLALLLGQAVGYAEPLLSWWQLGCGAAALASLPWLGVPVAVSGLVQLRWPFCLAASAWTLLVCASCWELEGGCAVPAGMASPAEVSVPHLAPPHLAPPRTGPDGRWPAMPSDRPGLGAAGAAVPGAGVAPPQPGSESRGLLESVPGFSSARDWFESVTGSSEGGPRQSSGTAAPGSEAPGSEAPGSEASGSEASGSAVQGERLPGENAPDITADPPASRREAPRDSTPRAGGLAPSSPGGWVSADHPRVERQLVRISVEHANRRPNAFFGGPGSSPGSERGGRRVYMPTDPIFQGATAQLRKQGGLELSRLANLLALHPERPVVLELHTDSSGAPDQQQRLSERRAEAIRDWLTDRGHLAPHQLEVTGMGGTRPLVPPDGSYAAQEPNRRLEVRLVDRPREGPQ